MVENKVNVIITSVSISLPKFMQKMCTYSCASGLLIALSRNIEGKEIIHNY